MDIYKKKETCLNFSLSSQRCVHLHTIHTGQQPVSTTIFLSLPSYESVVRLFTEMC